MGTNNIEIHRGLEGLTVAETRISRVNGQQGELVVAGKLVEDLAQGTFEDAAALVWSVVPGVEMPSNPTVALAEARRQISEYFSANGGWRWNLLRQPDVMDALRASVAALPDEDARFWRPTGAMAVLFAGWLRLQAGEEPIAPEPELSHAADILRMCSGVTPSPPEVRALNAYLCTVIDHGLNASTFAARVVTSTRSDLVSAITAAIGALKGPLHGGAPGPVLDMLDAIGTPDNAQSWLEAELERGERIMGMGHRVYRVRDPRAAVLETAARGLALAGVAREQLALARAVEETAERLLAERKPERNLRANVEFYTAILLDALGLPRESFTGVFAVSRVAGWTAHVLEERATGRLIRPRAQYVGALPGQPSSG